MLEVMQWQKAGFDPELGLDKHFYDLAQAAGKSVQGLETLDFQISLLRRHDDGPSRTGCWRRRLKEIDTERANVAKLMDAWKAGDAPTVERIVLSDAPSGAADVSAPAGGPQQGWMPKLEALFARKGRAFVVVGAAHLVGPDGLISCSGQKATPSSRCSAATRISGWPPSRARASCRRPSSVAPAHNFRWPAMRLRYGASHGTGRFRNSSSMNGASRSKSTSSAKPAATFGASCLSNSETITRSTRTRLS